MAPSSLKVAASLLLQLSMIVLPVALAHPAPPHSSFSWDETDALLVFGDSYSYVQGTAGRQNYSFIGDALDYSYTPGQLLRDEIVQNQLGTSAGGPNWVEYLTGCFAGLPAKCGKGKKDEKELWDFAFAGADVSTRYLALHHNYSVQLDSQVEQWSTYARPHLPIDPRRTLVAIWIGINDISDSAKFTNISSFPAYYGEIIDTLFDSVETVRRAGYRDFLFMQLPPLEKTPGNVVAAAQGKPLYPNATQVAAWNSILADRAARFARKPGVENALVFDTHGFLNGVIEHPRPYGIKNVTGYCPRFDAPDIATNYASYGCSPIDQYFWYNTGHVTYHVHEILARGVRAFLEGKSR